MGRLHDFINTVAKDCIEELSSEKLGILIDNPDTSEQHFGLILDNYTFILEAI